MKKDQNNFNPLSVSCLVFRSPSCAPETLAGLRGISLVSPLSFFRFQCLARCRQGKRRNCPQNKLQGICPPGEGKDFLFRVGCLILSYLKRRLP